MGPRLSREATEDIVNTIGTQIRDLLGLIASTDIHSQNSPLPSATGRYSAGATLGSIQFEISENFHISHLLFVGVGDSSLAHDLRSVIAGIDAMSKNAPTDNNARGHMLSLSTNLQRDTSIAEFPLFTIEAPVSRFAERVKGAPASYPAGLRGWNADLQFTFFVNTDGKADPSTIETVPATDSMHFESDRQRDAYLGFRKASIALLEDARFKPAEYLGCKVRRLVVIPMQFRMR